MDSLDHPRRQQQNLLSKQSTTSWVWGQNETTDYKGFKIYNQLAVPNSKSVAVCMECYECNSQNLEVSTTIWEIALGRRGNNSNHLKSHLQHRHMIYTIGQVATMQMQVLQMLIKHILLKLIASEALPLNFVESENIRRLIRYANPTISVISRGEIRTKFIEKKNAVQLKFKTFFHGKVIAATTDGWTSCKFIPN